MDICARCGIVAPRAGLPCESCRATERETAPAPARDLYFVQVTCQFQCRGCGRLAPLDAVDLSGVARCALCGLAQAFPPESWAEGLGFAHAVGDLARGEGLHPNAKWALGPANPYRDVARARASAQLHLDGVAQSDGLSVRRTLRMRAGPGHPVCATCAVPLQVAIEDEGRASTRCPGCGASGRYDVSADVLAACRGLRAVIAEPHRADLRDARTVTGDGVVALSCPSCGAPLRATGSSRTVECAFCHLVCRLPPSDNTVADAPPTPFWIAFRGTSAQRRALEAGSGPTALPAASEAPATGLMSWLGLLPAILVGGGALVVTGVVLFVLMRAGLLTPP